MSYGDSSAGYEPKSDSNWKVPDSLIQVLPTVTTLLDIPEREEWCEALYSMLATVDASWVLRNVPVKNPKYTGDSREDRGSSSTERANRERLFTPGKVWRTATPARTTTPQQSESINPTGELDDSYRPQREYDVPFNPERGKVKRKNVGVTPVRMDNFNEHEKQVRPGRYNPVNSQVLGTGTPGAKPSRNVAFGWEAERPIFSGRRMTTSTSASVPAFAEMKESSLPRRMYSQSYEDVYEDESEFSETEPDSTSGALLMMQEEMRKMSAMFNAQVAVLQQRASKAEQAILSVKQSNLYHVEQGAEDWIAQSILQKAMEPEYLFYVEAELRFEHKFERRLRMRIWAHCKATLPEGVTYGMITGDITSLTTYVINYNRENASRQLVDLRHEEERTLKRKPQMAMGEWLNALMKIYHRRELLKEPVTTGRAKESILMALENDKRYDDVLKDARNNPDWSMLEFRKRLEAAAHRSNDLVADPSKERKREAKKAAKAAKKQSKKSREGLDRIESKSKQALAAKGFPNKSTDSGVHPAETEGASRSKREQLSKELCQYFLLTGRCKNGDSCWRRHETFETAKMKLTNKGESPTQNDKSGKKRRGICAQYQTTGSCTFGDTCKFAHEDSPESGKKGDNQKQVKFNGKQGKMAKPLGGIPGGSYIKIGDVVMIRPSHATPELITSTAQVYDVMPDRCYLQMVTTPDRLSKASKQWIENAMYAGVPTTHLVKVSQASIQKIARFAKGGHQATDPYSLECVFDTGASHCFTNDLRIIDPTTLRDYQGDEFITGIAGEVLQATQHGTAYLQIGGREYPIAVDYCPGTVNTLLPGKYFDDGVNFAYGAHDQTMHIYKYNSENPYRDLLTSFPREIPLGDIQSTNQRFRNDFVRDGQKYLHNLYPVPDRLFKMYSCDYVKHALVTTRAQHVQEEVRDNAPVVPDGNVDASVVDQRSMTAVQRLLQYHVARAHRAAISTDLIAYEYEHNYRFPGSVRDNLPMCAACAVAKVTNKPARQTRLVSPKMPGEYVSADILVKFPRSPDGYQHGLNVHDVFSKMGGFIVLKTRESDQQLIAWLKRLHTVTQRHPSKLSIDSGEMLSGAVVAYCKEHGIDLTPSLADVHTNTSIERRNRTIQEMANAQLHTGGAPATLAMYAYLQANAVMNAFPSASGLLSVGRRRVHNPQPRPASPYEVLYNSGDLLDMTTIWKEFYPLFCFCVGFVEAAQRRQHQPRGFEGVYLGCISRNDFGITQYGHYVLRLADKRIVRTRTVKCDSRRFPFRPSVTLLNPVATPASGGEMHDLEEDFQDAAEVEAEVASDINIVPVDHFEPGTVAMTTAGPVRILDRYADGYYKVVYPDYHSPDEVYSIKPQDVWLMEDYPDWEFDGNGRRIQPLEPEKNFKPRAQKAQVFVEPTEERQAEKDTHVVAVTARYPLRSRKKAMRAIMSQIRSEPPLAHTWNWDPGGEAGVTLSHYDYHCPEGALRKGLKVQRSTLPTLPDDFDTSLKSLKEMKAHQVQALLPKHFHQTLSHPFREHLELAENLELQDCMNRDVWGNPEYPPEGIKVIGLMWVYACKETPEGLFDKFKGRITLMGNQERTMLSKLDAYAPVHMVVTLRILIGLHLGTPGVKFRHMDIKNAYINEYMKRSVWCKMPPGYLFYTDDGELSYRRLKPGEKQPTGKALPLIKALYGGMECGRIFYEAFLGWHLEYGFQMIHEDRCYLHLRSEDGESWIKFVFHVDDNAIVYKGEEFYAKYLKDLQTKFDVKEEELKQHLGVNYHIDYEANTVRIEQTSQIDKVLESFGMEKCTGVKHPTMSGRQPSEEDCEEPSDIDFDMESFLGHMQYLHICTRPDIGHMLRILSRFPRRFGKRHVEAAKHLLRYLRATRDKGLEYSAGLPQHLQIFTDASHASDPDNRRSTLSIVVKLGGNTIYWKTTLSKLVCHSSCESELLALDVGATTSRMVKWLVEAMGGPTQKEIQMFVDNQGTIDIASNPVQSGRNLHVHARYFYVRDLVYEQEVEICKIATENQIADVGCTFKGGPNFDNLTRYLMGCARAVHNRAGEVDWQLWHANAIEYHE